MAQHRLATEEQLVEMTRNEALRKNPEALWSILNRFADLSDLQREAEQLRSQTESLRAERDSFQAKYESLSGRRVVRMGTKVADSVKSIVGAAS
jgi:uncharacterized protein YhaN